MSIRLARESDADDLYAVCLGTGSDGSDATDLYDDPRLLGEVFVGPYLRHSPEFAWVYADDDDRARGYVLGVLDTTAFEEVLATSWWPRLQARHPLVPPSANAHDREIIEYVHRPQRRPSLLTIGYPSHLHIDMLPDVQGNGRGGRMLRTLLDALAEAGSPGVHLGVSAVNHRAIGFYQHFGFAADPSASSADELVMSRRL
jgi:ribosomal protein S18 acetylase RimI-like enzyme